MAESSVFRLLCAILAFTALASVHFDATGAASTWAPPEAAAPTPARAPAPAPEPVQADRAGAVKAMFSGSTPGPAPAPEPVRVEEGNQVPKPRFMFGDSTMKLVQSESQTPVPTPTPTPAQAQAQDQVAKKPWFMSDDSVMKLVQSQAQTRVQTPAPAPAPQPGQARAQAQDQQEKKPWFMFGDSDVKLVQSESPTRVQTPAPAPIPAEARDQVATKRRFIFGYFAKKLVQSITQTQAETPAAAPTPTPTTPAQAQDQETKKPWFMFEHSAMKPVQSEAQTPTPSPTPIPAQAQDQAIKKPWFMFGDSTSKPIQSPSSIPSLAPQPAPVAAETQDQTVKKPWFMFDYSTLKPIQSASATPSLAPQPAPGPAQAQHQALKKPWFMFGESTLQPIQSPSPTPSLAPQPAPVPPAQAQSPRERRMADQKKPTTPRFKSGDITTASARSPTPVPQALVPLFIFGDSTLDVGTNNFVQNCSATANFLYNGIDFPDGPTGRFSNGFNTADEIAKQLGYEMSPPPYLSLVETEECPQLHQLGANFASGGSGILNSTGKQQFGKVIWLGEQIQQFSELRDCMIKAAAGDVASVDRKISTALFLISVGSNDIFEFPVGSNLNAYLSDMEKTYQGQLKKLYKLGARKFGILSIPPIGCCPVARSRTGDGGCFDPANTVAQLFNSQVKELLETFSQDTYAKYSMANMFNTTLDLIKNPKGPGRDFVNVESACCGDANYPCNQTASLCNNHQGFMFWDRFHPTQAISEIAANVAFHGSSNYVFPINFAQLLEG